VTPESFGGQLRKLRVQRRVTLEAIEKRTKISIGLLRSLENGGCEGWPGGIYSRGYVRAYAEAIGVDPDHVVAAFVECYPAFAPAPAVEVVPDAEVRPPTLLERVDRWRRDPIGPVLAALKGWFRAAAAAPSTLERVARRAEHRLGDERQWQRAQPDKRVVE
jgi:transcriptional regulator with XRE-family HTH domain